MLNISAQPVAGSADPSTPTGLSWSSTPACPRVVSSGISIDSIDSHLAWVEGIDQILETPHARR